ncbi:MAG: hypothetical protein LCH52_08475 [Bacteroidetes bacterium]|nr:hypothetical protein [Bacteroidota bacterium]
MGAEIERMDADRSDMVDTISPAYNVAIAVADSRSVVEKAITNSKELIVFDSDDVALANHHLKILNKANKEIEETRKKFTEPLETQKKRIIAEFKSITSLVDTEILRLKSQLMEFEKRERLKAQEEQRAAQKALEEEQERRRAEERSEIARNGFTAQDSLITLPQTGLDSADYKVEVVPRKPITGVNITRKKTWSITDFNLIPREYLQVDSARIDKLRAEFDFETTSQPIPGIKFEFTESVRV